MTNKTRVLYLLQYMKEQSDEGKAVTNTDIKNFFLSRGEKVTLPRSGMISLLYGKQATTFLCER